MGINKMNKKGVVLIISILVMTIVLVLTGVYFSSLLTEKKAADTEEFVLQALGLAEAGANHALSELRERIRTDLKNRLETVSLASVIQDYVTANNSLGFLSAYAYANGDTPFTVLDSEARLTVTTLPGLNTAIQGTYTAIIIVKANGNPTNPANEVFTFPYKYTIEAAGQITRPNITRNLKLLQGNFVVTVRRDTFAKFALFTSHHKMPAGTTVWFTANTNFTGPLHTNERFSFANNPSGHFTEEVTQHLTTARFYNNGSTKLLDADRNPVGCCPQCIQCTAWPGCCEGADCTTCCVENSACSNKPSCVTCKDYPVFDTSFQRSYDLINLPSTVTQNDLRNQALGGAGEPGANGIYIPNDGTNVTGGIYIRGNQGSPADDSTINMAVGTNGPVYTISRSGSPTTTVTVDYLANEGIGSTTVNGLTYRGIPDGVSNEGIIIYVNDDISSLSGTVEENTAATVSSERDIVITNHILYEEYNPSPLSAEGYDNVLGILSWGGNVRIGTTAPNDINIHGIVMAPHGVFSVDNYNVGSPRGTATLLGGLISEYYGPFGTFSGSNPVSGYGRNFVYDPRVLGGIVPPYFPYMANFTSTDDNGLDRKLVWEDEGV